MKSNYKPHVCLLLWAIIFLLATPAMASDIYVKRLRGICEYQRDGAPWVRIAPRMRLKEGDAVRTGWRSDLTVTYDDGSILRISEQTSVILHADGVPGSKSAVKGLAELIFGRLRMKITPSRESVRIRATSSTAVMGVRGTAFFLAGNAKQTAVGVTQGIVTVANIKIPGETVDVAAGMKTIVYAGLPPMSPVPLSAGEGKEVAAGGSALDRIEDVVVEETEQMPTEKFIAFSDVHIDSIRNPAYAAGVETTETQVLGRMGLSRHARTNTPDTFSITGATVTDVSEKKKNKSNSGEVWATTFYPVQSGDVLGAFGSFQRQRVWDKTTFTGIADVGGVGTPFVQTGRAGSPDMNSRFQAVDIGAIAAHPTPILDVGILVRYHSSASTSDFQYLLDLPGLPADSDLFSARGTSDLKELILGVRRVAENGVEWGWSLGRTGSHADIRDTDHTMGGVASPLQRTKESFDGWHTEVRARQQLSDKWRWGASLRMIFLNGTGDLTDDTGLSFTESVHDRFYRLGFGVGYTPDTRTAIGLDLVAGLRKETANLYFLSGNPREKESENNPSVALHLGGQRWLTDRLFCFADGTLFRRRSHLDLHYFDDAAGSLPTHSDYPRGFDNLSELMLGLGYKIHQNAWVEYLMVNPLPSGLNLQHNLMIRFRL